MVHVCPKNIPIHILVRHVYDTLTNSPDTKRTKKRICLLDKIYYYYNYNKLILFGNRIFIFVFVLIAKRMCINLKRTLT